MNYWIVKSDFDKIKHELLKEFTNKEFNSLDMNYDDIEIMNAFLEKKNLHYLSNYVLLHKTATNLPFVAVHKISLSERANGR